MVDHRKINESYQKDMRDIQLQNVNLETFTSNHFCEYHHYKIFANFYFCVI